MTDIEMMPLPEWCHGWGESLPRGMQTYARAVAEHNVKKRDAEIEALRAERDSFQRVGIREQERADQLQAELDNRWAQGVHTCHDKCQRIACVLRRENERLAEALRHQRWCRTCAEDGWENCEDGRKADALLNPTAALPDHNQEKQDEQ